MKKKYLRINSQQNGNFKLWRNLTRKKYRDREELFLVEGMHLVEEAQKAGVLKEVIVLDGEKLPDIEADIYHLTERLMDQLTNLVTIPKIMGVCKKIIPKEDLGKKIIMLDNVRDPGNLGTIIRSSVAFGMDTIILGDYCCDLYNPKVISATQGMMFQINIIHIDTDIAIEKIKEKKIKLYGTNVKEGKELKSMKPEKSFCFIVGNEGMGLAEETMEKCDELINIKTKKSVESLNVAVASSIIIYQLSE